VNAKRVVIVGYAAIAAFAIVRVGSTERVFSATFDEPMHLACGLDWLYGRPYTAQPDNPPLARIAAALPFAIERAALPPPSEDVVGRGNALLYAGDYRRDIARARAGNLFFLLVAIVAVGRWSARRFGEAAGLAAAALFAWLPPVRAHAGLATTDMAAAAAFAAALLAFDRWRDDPTPARGAVLGVVAGAGALCKFSLLPFFTIAVAIAGLLDLPRIRLRALRKILWASAAAALTIWAGYRFEFGALAGADRRAPSFVAMATPAFARDAATWTARHVPLPAPMFFTGAAELAAENGQGHPGFLFGVVRQHGCWYYFPVAVFFKTPIPFLLLAFAGAGAAIRRGGRAREAALLPAAMLASLFPASIDIGVRHALPIFVPLAALAGAGLAALAKRPETRIAAALLLVWMAWRTEAAHPDYLAWFNEAAGRHPERILEDSNLDWGQDYLRLTETIEKERIRRCAVFFSGTVVLQRHLDDPRDELRPASPGDRSPGWYAIPEGVLAMDADAQRGAYAWLDDYAFRRIGKSIRLYHVPR